MSDKNLDYVNEMRRKRLVQKIVRYRVHFTLDNGTVLEGTQTHTTENQAKAELEWLQKNLKIIANEINEEIHTLFE